MTSELHDAEPGEILPSDTPQMHVTAADVASLSERFYDLFDDVRPLGQRDLAFFKGLLTDFSHHLDLAEELKRFQAWSLDKGDGAVQSPRSRFRDWLTRALDYRRHFGEGKMRRTRR